MGGDVPINLLVVDDVDRNRAALRAMLTPAYNVVEASSGEEALKKLLELDYAVLLLDVVMPEIDGFSLARLVRQRARSAIIPILFVTGNAMDQTQMFEGYRAGAVDYLIKPLDVEIVRAKVGVFAQLYRQRKQLELSLAEKEVLLREIHHRVKNNLQIVSSLLHLQGQLLPAAVNDMFLESETRVRSIALVHETLCESESITLIDAKTYLEDVVMGLVQTYGVANITVHTRLTTAALTIDVATSCGLLVNELVSNAFKHAFPTGEAGTVDVVFEKIDGGYRLCVSDSGIGLPEKPVDRGKLGLQLVDSLMHQLCGAMKVSREHGTTIAIEFPS